MIAISFIPILLQRLLQFYRAYRQSAIKFVEGDKKRGEKAIWPGRPLIPAVPPGQDVVPGVFLLGGETGLFEMGAKRYL